MKNSTRLELCGLITGMLLVAGAATGQTLSVTGSSTPAQPAGFKSAGISAVITSTSLVPPGLVMQFIIQNGRPTPIYISPITSAGVGAAAMSSKGTMYTISQNGLGVSGMGPCDLNGGDFNDSISKCLKGFAIENMTYLDPGQSTVLAVTYDRRSNVEDTADTVSFVLKFLVRGAPKDADQVALSADKTPQAGPPGVVTISFPLVPIKAPQ